MPEFGMLDSEGNYEKLGHIEQSDMLKCPNRIIDFEHYRDDGTCRCDDPQHLAMLDWGYVWKRKLSRWSAP